MSITIYALVISGVLCLTGIYLLFFPADFRARLAKDPNRWVRYLGMLSICAGVLFLGLDIQSQATLKFTEFMRSMEKAYKDSSESDPNVIDSQQP